MVHPATRRAVKAAITALDVPLDIGVVFQPKPGEDRGYGHWTNRDLGRSEIMAMLPRCAAANARGGNIYVRLGPTSKAAHPGVLTIDDLAADAVQAMQRDGLEPCLVVQTSSGNHQAWIRLIGDGNVPYATMGEVARNLASVYDGDPRAVSPRQPARLPGFTNRKPKHQQDDGQFPFVRITHAEPGRVASKGNVLIEKLATRDTAGAAAGAARETPRAAAGSIAEVDADIMARLAAIHDEQRARLQKEVAAGRRPAYAASASEVDFAVARAALKEGIAAPHIAAWIRQTRSDKHVSYPQRTVEAAEKYEELLLTRSVPGGGQRPAR